MSSEPTSSSAAETAAAIAADALVAAAVAESELRRSKRKKFTLDVVAAAHGNNQKKSRKDPHGQEEFNEDEYEEVGELEQLSVVTDESIVVKKEEEDSEADDSLTRRRPRRSTTFQAYQQDTMANYVEMNMQMDGPHKCTKCPSRYVSKSSLANHVKMHMGETRKYACELCDFSSSTYKSLAHHHNVHKALGVLSAPISPAEATSESTEALPPLDTSTESNSSLNGGAAPQLFVAAEEPFHGNSDALEDEEDEMMMPPVLEREDDGPPVLMREAHVKMEDPDSEDETKESTPPRKSGRAAKPTHKRLEQKLTKKGLLKPLRLDTPLSNPGSLPTSSASSITPPERPSPATSTESSRESTPELKGKGTKKNSSKAKLKKRKRCAQCPYVTGTLSRLKRHYAGHQVKEGYICPIENCHFITRKAGFLPKHFILHVGHTLSWPPKYVKKVGKKIIEMPELNEHLGEKSQKKEKTEKKESKVKVEIKQEPVEETKEAKQPEESKPEKTENTEKKAHKKIVKKKKVAVKKEKKVVEKKQTEKKKNKKKVKRVELIAQAQIKSHKTVEVDGVTHKKCNVGECDFQTVSLTQLIYHKTIVHAAKNAFPSHPFVCITCGHRSKNYASLRTHKLTNHLSASRRFHRTYYLKEIVGDKFFIKHFLSIPEPETPEASEAPAVEPIVEEKRQEDEEDPSGDESFDTIQSADVTSEAVLALMEGNSSKPLIFCCNLCPYKAPISSRLHRHFNKHFTNDTYKCQFCGWSSRDNNMLVKHEKLHSQSEGAEGEETKMGVVEERQSEILMNIKKEIAEEEESPRMKIRSSRSRSVEDSTLDNTNSSNSEASGASEDSPSENREEHPLQEPLRKWCAAEKLRRPEIDDQFTRVMIDGVKGFKCSDCPYTSKYRGDMRSHKKRHDIEQTYRCVQCTYTTNRPVSLKDHLKQHLNVNNTLATIQARKVIVHQGINIGMRRGIGKDRVYCCGKCPYSTLALGCLWRHYRNHRATAKINICSNCSYSSIDQRKMEEHTIIHLAMGVNEPMPFVKRVDQNGRPVSSLTDLNLNGTERKANKRKMESEESQEGAKMAKKAQALALKSSKPEKLVKKTDTPTPEKTTRRRLSKEQTPDSDYSQPGPSSQPTRTLSERATRNRINYSLLSKSGGSGKPTPSSSSAHLDKMAQEEKEPDESSEVTHHRIRKFLHTNYGQDVSSQCPECPFKTNDPKVFEQHHTFHEQTVPPRTQQCSDCSFNTYTPSSLLQHLKLHSEGVSFDPLLKRMQKHNRKGDHIPPGVKGYYCKNCSFKTANHRNFVEHSAYHRHQLINRITISMKRQPPKPEYKRPKHKHLFVAKNAKYCKKCTFKCASHSAYIEHLDRHGWGQLYKCYICDYSDNNKSVVDFHQLTHHIVRDQTLHAINQASEFRLEQGEIMKPENVSKEKPTPEEFVQQSRSLLKCGSCDFFCHVSSELAFHMSVNHMDQPDAKETISYLHMGLVPPNAKVTTVL